MSLWTCIACSARHAVGLLTCPQCGASAHEEGDTISPAEGVEGAAHIAVAPPAVSVTAPQPPLAEPAPAPADAPPEAAP